jgi:cell division protein FtsW
MSVDSPSRVEEITGRFQSFRKSFDRPLTVYYVLIGASALLLAIGLMMVLSASSVYSYRNNHHDSYYIFFKQLQWVIVGLPVAFMASRFPQRWVRWLAWPSLILAIVLLALVQTPLGHSVNGNRNWLRLGPVQIQPSEVAKLAIILWSAHVLSMKEKLLGQARHVVIPVAPVVILMTGLVVLGHDLGTALVMLAILLGVLVVAGLPGRWFWTGLAVVGVAVLGLATTSTERRERMTTFMNPFQDFNGKGWQAGNGLLGMSNGGLFGRGLSASQQKWGNLPEAHTDFIFAVIGEEWGLFGTLLVLSLFAALLWAAFRLATSTEDPFVCYVTTGVTVWVMFQVIINIGMVLAIFPVIGLPLPLVSYGGSALIPTLVALGLLIGFARNEPAARAALDHRRRTKNRPASVGDSITAVTRWRSRFEK